MHAHTHTQPLVLATSSLGFPGGANDIHSTHRTLYMVIINIFAV